MKKTLTKILLISLLFSATMPSTVQANLNWITLKNGAIVATALAVTAFAWKLSRQRKLNSDFWEAVREENVAKIKQALKSNADVNKQDYLSGRTALMSIVGSIGIKEFSANARQGLTVVFPEIINTLLSANGIDINKQDKWGHTALMYATEFGLLEISRKLLEHNADPYIKNNDGKNAFDLILSNNQSSAEHEKEQFKKKMLEVIENKKLTT